MKYVLLCLALLGCAAPEQTPSDPGFTPSTVFYAVYRVDIDPSLSEAQTQMALDAADRVNALLGRTAVKPVIAAREDGWDGHITVRPGLTAREQLGLARWTARWCSVELWDGADTSIVVHELLHCLGLPHSEYTDNVMYEYVTDETWTADLTEEQKTAAIAWLRWW